MSAEYLRISARVLEEEEVRPKDVVVLAALASVAHRGPWANVGLRHLAGIVRMTVPTVRESLGRLEELKFLEVSKGGHGRRDGYKLAGEFYSRKGKPWGNGKKKQSIPRMGTPTIDDVAAILGENGGRSDGA